MDLRAEITEEIKNWDIEELRVELTNITKKLENSQISDKQRENLNLRFSLVKNKWDEKISETDGYSLLSFETSLIIYRLKSFFIKSCYGHNNKYTDNIFILDSKKMTERPIDKLSPADKEIFQKIIQFSCSVSGEIGQLLRLGTDPDSESIKELGKNHNYQEMIMTYKKFINDHGVELFRILARNYNPNDFEKES